MGTITYKTREQWLNAAIKRIRPLFRTAGKELPDNIRVSCGWPVGRVNKITGQIMSQEISESKHFEIFISPMLSDSVKVMGTLIHELVHATVGLDKGHSGEFKTLALRLGLTGKMTSTTIGEELNKTLGIIKNNLGEYPHGKVKINKPRETPTRVKLYSPVVEGLHVLMSSKWLESHGAPLCPYSQREMVSCDPFKK